MDLLSRETATICAPITALGTAGVGVIRVSGPQALEFTRKVCPFLPENPESHRIYYGISKNPKTSENLDEILTSYFAHGKSFTGEECLELSCHGSPVILANHLSALAAAGCIPAERGEFTFRAFMNGRIDLVQAESVLSLIQSQSAQAARIALRQLQGGLSDEIQKIEDHLTWVLANIEAGIDFSTEDIDVIAYEEIRGRVASALAVAKRLVGTYESTRPLVQGLRVVLAGRPNAGKSSLLNALLQQEKAIVTEVPGTTRDLIEGTLKLPSGWVTLVDTAGLRETQDLVESIGIKAAHRAQLESDYIFYLMDLGDGPTPEDIEILKGIDAAKLVVAGTKADKNSTTSSKLAETISRALGKTITAERVFVISSVSGQGLHEIPEFLEVRLREALVDDSAVVIQRRHFELLSEVSSKAATAVKLLQEKASLEFVALELQEALLAVYQLLGKKFDDQVMDRVFKEFCIGK